MGGIVCPAWPPETCLPSLQALRLRRQPWRPGGNLIRPCAVSAEPHVKRGRASSCSTFSRSRLQFHVNDDALVDLSHGHHRLTPVEKMLQAQQGVELHQGGLQRSGCRSSADGRRAARWSARAAHAQPPSAPRRCGGRGAAWSRPCCFYILLSAATNCYTFSLVVQKEICRNSTHPRSRIPSHVP